jgi:tripartite-type tricarboxylate transporter receptor subunit TctC
VVAKLNAQINASLNSPELKARLLAEGAQATPDTPEAFGRLIASEIERWRPVVKAGNVRPG